MNRQAIFSSFSFAIMVYSTINNSEVGQLKTKTETLFEVVMPRLDFKSKVCLGKSCKEFYIIINPAQLVLNTQDCTELDFDSCTYAFRYFAEKGDRPTVKFIRKNTHEDNIKKTRNALAPADSLIEAILYRYPRHQQFNFFSHLYRHGFKEDNIAATKLYLKLYPSRSVELLYAAADQSTIIFDYLLLTTKPDISHINDDGKPLLHSILDMPIKTEENGLWNNKKEIKNKNILTLIQQPNIDLNSKDKEGNTVLLVALNEYNKEIIITLCNDNRVDKFAINNAGNTALHILARHNQVDPDALNLLYQIYPQSVTMKNKEGNTPLHYAIATNVIKFLLPHYSGDTINVKNEQGETPLHLSFKSRTQIPCPQHPHLEVAIVQFDEKYHILLEQPTIQVNAQNENGQTALHCVIEALSQYEMKSMAPFMIEELLNHPEINPNVPDKNGKTPLDYTSESDTQVIDLLLKKGATRQSFFLKYRTANLLLKNGAIRPSFFLKYRTAIIITGLLGTLGTALFAYFYYHGTTSER